MKKILIGCILLGLFYMQNLNYMSVDMTQYEKDHIEVEIKGEVVNPGVYTLSKNATYNDLIETCGGLNENADISSLNLTSSLYDSDVIVIQSKTLEVKISINAGTQEELETLPGIGPSTAKKIIQYRETKGSFQTLEDIMNVSGIKEKTYEKIKDSICL